MTVWYDLRWYQHILSEYMTGLTQAYDSDVSYLSWTINKKSNSGDIHKTFRVKPSGKSYHQTQNTEKTTGNSFVLNSL